MASSEALARAWADQKSAKDDFSLASARLFVAEDSSTPLVLGRPTDFEHSAIGERLECPICCAETNPFYDDVVVALIPCCGIYVCVTCLCLKHSMNASHCHMCGIPLPSTRQECERLLFAKAAKGIKFAEHFLGMYHCGMGPAESTSVVAKPAPKLGLSLLERAVSTGKVYAPSARILAQMYTVGHLGLGIERDLQKASELLDSSHFVTIEKDVTLGKDPSFYTEGIFVPRHEGLGQSRTVLGGSSKR